MVFGFRTVLITLHDYTIASKITINKRIENRPILLCDTYDPEQVWMIDVKIFMTWQESGYSSRNTLKMSTGISKC